MNWNSPFPAQSTRLQNFNTIRLMLSVSVDRQQDRRPTMKSIGWGKKGFHLCLEVKESFRVFWPLLRRLETAIHS